jgi:RNA polymerase sigma factor for flagellar operon FliA
MAIHSPLEPTPEQLFLEHLPSIKLAARSACRDRHLGPEDTEDFISIVTIKLIENDYEVIRKFTGKGGCTLKTYLVVVVNHAIQDYLNHLWGKWRPSAEAKRLGPLAILIERLLRDGYTFDEVCELLRTNYHVDKSRQELEELRNRLPPRPPRPMNGGEEPPEVPDPREGPDGPILEKERQARREKALEALRRAQETLSPEDRLILKMRSSPSSVAIIARSLGLEQKPLYRRIDRLLKTLREILEGEGVDPDDVL